ncbi:hypothetical protein Tco_0019891 [Tanacetum coccineum]
MPLSVWKKLGLPEIISTQMTLELANWDICTPKGIARDVFVLVGKFTFPADFVIVDYESDPCVPLILGRPFLRTARLINVHGEEMILRDGNERLILNMRHDTSSYSTQPHQTHQHDDDNKDSHEGANSEDLFATNNPSGNPDSSLTSHTDLTSPEVNDYIFAPWEQLLRTSKSLKTKDHPPYHDNPLSGIPTPISETVTKSSSSPTLTFLEESDLITVTRQQTNDTILPAALMPIVNHKISLTKDMIWRSGRIEIISCHFIKERKERVRHILRLTDPEEDIRLVERLLYDNSSPRPPEEYNFENSDAIIEPFSPSPIPIEDSDSLIEEIDLFLTPDDSMPSGIENDDYESEGDILFLEDLLSNDSPSLYENESFHFDVPSYPRPHGKPPDDDEIEPDTGVLTTKVVGDISKFYVHVPNVLTTLPTLSPMFDTLLPFSSENDNKVFNHGILASNEKKSPHLLSHRGFNPPKIISDFSKNTMMIYEEDIPILDVLIAPDFEASRARGFVLRSLELQSSASL